MQCRQQAPCALEPSNFHCTYSRRITGYIASLPVRSECNLSAVPILTVDNHSIGQSRAINRFLAHRFGFFGSNDIEAAKIDAIAEHFYQFVDSHQRHVLEAQESARDTARASFAFEWYLTEIEKTGILPN